MYWRRPPTRPAPDSPAPIPAALAMLAREKYDDLPPGGYAGEWLASAPAAPALPPPQPLELPRPDWAAEEEEERQRLAAHIDTGPRPGPVEAMLAEARERGEIDEPPSPIAEPPVEYAPLQRFTPPPPNWREEERLRAYDEERERAREARYRRLLEIIDREGT